MITGFLSRWDEEKHCFPEAFDRALAFLRATEAARRVPGRYCVEGEALVAITSDAPLRPMAGRRFELHREFIDIHVLHEGLECHAYACLPPGGPALEDRLAADDAAFYPLVAPEEGLQTLLLRPGQYAVYLPGELHCPCCAPEWAAPDRVLKTVLKIHRSLLF